MQVSQSNRVIIIDDDESYREVLARSLSRLNFKPLSFAKPEDALTAISAHETCLVLLDLKLENDSGLVWIKSIK
ncbi:MAG: response regulator, partial [Kangiellaceae bacterium]